MAIDAAARCAPARLSPLCRADPHRRMRGAMYTRHGSPDVLQVRDDLPAPAASARHALVRVAAAGVNPVDFKVRHHDVARIAVPLPKIPGTDLAGVIEHSPPGCPFPPGQRVFGMMPLLGSPWGATAELVPVEPRLLAPLPDGVSAEDAASLPLVGLTVLQGIAPVIQALGDLRGGTALVQAASGGTGSLAVQLLARVHGMRVIGTCSAANAALVRSLGADEVIDYREEAFDEHVRDVDLVFDPLGYRYARRTLRSRVIRPGGHYVHLASSEWAQGRAIRGAVPEAMPGALLQGFGRALWTRLAVPLGLARVHVHHLFVHPDGASLRALVPHLADGRIRAVLDRVYALDDIAQAHNHVEQGHTRGKVVVRIS